MQKRWGILAMTLFIAEIAAESLYDNSSLNHHGPWRVHKKNARLRHSRHLVDRSPFLHYEDSIPDLAAIKVKPVIFNCSRYHPVIHEEQPLGTFVLQINAVDRDSLHNGRKVTYSLVTPEYRPKFSIDPDTGIIITKHIFDRDEPNNEKEFYLTVTATDIGNPLLHDDCILKVTVVDINDNKPVFVESNYHAYIPEDSMPGEILRISAVDIDDGNNSKILFKLEASQNKDENFFKIDRHTGVLYLKNPINHHAGHHFQLTAIASDEGDQHLSSSVDIDISIIESNKKVPTFTSLPASPIILLENFTDFTHNLAMFTAISNTDEHAPMFDLVIGLTEHTNKLGTFRLVSKSNTAYIRLGRHLDYERVSEYILTIRILNKHKLSAETTISVQVKDVNDNIPHFLDASSGLILENEPPGTLVMQVHAIDEDGTSENNKVSYELKNYLDHFSIDPNTGIITSLKIFDLKKQHSYNIKVLAIDNSPSSLYATGEHNKDEQVFSIKVGHKSDQTQKVINFVNEAKPEDLLTEMKTYVNITDNLDFNHYSSKKRDKNNTKHRHARHMFDRAESVNTGVPSINSSLHDDSGHFHLPANDEGHPLLLTSVYSDDKVVESGKKAPEFLLIPTSPVTVKENFSDFSYNIATLKAKSNSDDEAPIFELISGPTEHTNKLKTFRLISESDTAFIRLGRYLDYETVAEYTLTIRILNNDLAAETSVNIQVEDVNDNFPVFTNVASGVVLEKEPPGTAVMQVEAIDDDGTSAHNKVIYGLADNEDNFTIDPFTGKITTLKPLDHNQQEVYNVKVVATDNSPSALLATGEHNSGQHVFRIEVANKNHHPPRFLLQAVHENSNSLLTEIKALHTESDDNTLNHRITRRTHKTTAKLRHSRHSGSRESYIDNYQTDDMISDIQKVASQENHKPVFTNCSTYLPSVKEEEQSGTFVFRVQATDRDPIDNGGRVTYTFVSSPGDRLRFNIDPNTGNITTRHMFDRDEPSREKEVYLTVRATDNGRPQLDDVCTIKVVIEDINDNSPVFDKVSYQESVPQDLVPEAEVMRISATDLDDGKNSIVTYDLEPRGQDKEYFKIDKYTGFIFLKKQIDKEPGYKFRLRATATDNGEVPLTSTIDLDIIVVESNKKAPAFTLIPASPIILLENLTDFTYNIATLTAISHDEKAPVFELVAGRTEQTNKLGTFRLESEGNTAHIRLARHMDYESIADYTLTIRIQNKYNLAAETSISIQLEDVNDNIPSFTEVLSGVVLENELQGTPVMQVRAIDADSTTAHNQVTYELADNQDNFAIDPYTGNITTLKIFDREEQDFYNVKVIATDNSPSALFTTGEHNQGQQVFRIEIADKNDHPPKFTQSVYIAEAIAEDANTNSLVTEVKALDNDTASPVSYSIIEGNEYNSFSIEGITGKIRVKNQLDYENKTSYTLRVRAFDGAYEDFCSVEIKIENVNDNPPIFTSFNDTLTITEETLVDGCIRMLEAYDPDISDINQPQHIVYFVVKEEQKKLLKIDENGCLSLIKPLDRDPPNGFETWQVLVAANDDDGSPTSLRGTTDVVIALRDVNDNAPYLDMVQPVVWRENQNSGVITPLTAKDYDSPVNGPPFHFSIAETADSNITSKFSIKGDDLYASVRFDREEKKSYMIPIAITDSGNPAMTGTSTLHVVIGDVNDNSMKEGHSSIFVYNYKGDAPDTEIGRVYVEDPDDWDLPDKHFQWLDNSPHSNFDLNYKTGMITMLHGTLEQTYHLQFRVTEESAMIKNHTVMAYVNVTVKEIPEEAVDKSGSIRFAGITAEEFIQPDSNGINKQSILRRHLAKYFNISEDNVDVFTVLHSPHNTNSTQLDVRFSAHGSPYYLPEKLNAEISRNKEELEKGLGVTMLMINIDECLIEKLYCNSSCTNFLNKSNAPSAVYTNTTSFVGVSAVVDPLCKCGFSRRIFCHNGGTPVGDGCECRDGFEGPHCEIVAIGFSGNGWALYPTIESCADSHLSLELRPNKPNGLVFYVGPTNPNPALHVQDFMSLEIQNGVPVLLVDFGTGTVRIEQTQIPLNDGEQHRIDIFWTKTSIELQVDNCKLPTCLKLTLPAGPNEYLNVNGPLQVGGSFVDLAHLGSVMNWTHKPSNVGFNGCIRNFTFNGKLYNLGSPSLSENVDLSCSHGVAVAISFGIDTSFLVAIFICLAILLILLLAVVVHRRKTDDLYKDTDDIRENIINYEDEGGGEGDMTGYDLNVLRLMYDDAMQDKHQPDHLVQRPGGDEVPDICGFLDGKKQSVDNDPETNPFDDVRHYAYEGDGNTTGSLSSLASGTDEGDLNFDYLSNFGPRFRKLADMYGEDPSDEEEDNYQHTASESWC